MPARYTWIRAVEESLLLLLPSSQMTNFAELPDEILDSIAYVDELTEEWENVPPRHYARQIQDERRLVVHLSQVNRRLRQIFLPRLWRKVDLYHVKDIYLVDTFLLRMHSDLYGPLIEHLVFSWGDSVHADGLRGEVYMDEHNQDHGLFGRKQDWLFQDRKALLMRTELAEDHHNYPDMTLEEFFDFQWNWTEEYQDYRITEAGPDGWGHVPGISSPNDVADALVRISSLACNVIRLDYNERYIPIPPCFLANFNRLKSITLYSDTNHQDTRDSALEELPVSLQHMDIMYIFGKARSAKGQRAAPYFSLRPNEGKLGVAYKEIQDSADNESQRRLRKTCAAILSGLEHGSLQTLKMWDHELLRVAEMLPCWCALELQRVTAEDSAAGWGLQVRLLLTMGEQRSDCVLDAITTFKACLQGRDSAEEVQHWCRQQVSKSSDDDTFNLSTVASWVAEDEALCQAVVRGLNYNRTKP